MNNIAEQITRLKKEKNAIILAHYYAPPEVQDIADHLGDSLALSQLAAKTEADMIVFGGVHFMAETAAILCPDKTVLSPAPDAGCSLADSVETARLAKWREEHPDGIVVSYVNTTAAVKALTDWCCTSANAVKVVESLPEGHPILFGPDKNLGRHIMQVTGRKMELWDGVCKVHDVITSQTVTDALEKYPDADILIHPECECSGDKSLIENGRILFASTAGMLRHVAASPKKTFVVATESDIIHELKKKNPEKVFVPIVAGMCCDEMKKVTLENILESLETGKGRVVLDETLRSRALLPIQRMLAL